MLSQNFFSDQQNHVQWEQWFDLFFHAPTLLVCAWLSFLWLWVMYDVDILAGNGFLGVSSNHGRLLLYWLDGCCYLQR